MILALDPGAERMGYAFLDEGPTYIESGIYRCPRQKDEKYQTYKIRLEEFWSVEALPLLTRHPITTIVNEIVPAVGGGNFVVATQSELTKTAITAVHVIAFMNGVGVRQVAANKVKLSVTGNSAATKVGVRNGVIEALPELANKKSSWLKEFDEPDAIAIGLTWLGYRKQGK